MKMDILMINKRNKSVSKALLIISIITILIFFVLNTSKIQSQSAGIVHTTSSLIDGDLIKTANHPDIYIVKIIFGEKYKRLILNPTIFESYGHLEWSNVKTVSSSTLADFTNSQFVREVNADGSIVNGRVYMLFPNGDFGIKRHIQLSRSEFLAIGGRDNSIYNMNHLEASETFYVTGPPIVGQSQFRDLAEETLTGTPKPSNPSTAPVNPPSVIPLPIPDFPDEELSSKIPLLITKQTLQPTTILPGSKKEVLTINVLVSNRSATVRSIKVALSPTTGTDTSIENTFNQIQLIVDGSVVSTKNIESTQDYEKVLNTAVITLNNLAIDIEEDSTKSIQIHLSTNTTIQESLLKDWNIIINKDSISAIDDDNNTYSNNNPITISTSVRRTNIPTTRPPSTVRNFTASLITTTSLTLSWDEYTDATGYQLDYCEGSSCTNYSNLETITALTKRINSLTQGTVYKFRIRAVLPDNKYSAYRRLLQETAPKLPIPSNFRITSSTETSVTLEWDEVARATGYVIDYCAGENCVPDETSTEVMSAGNATTVTITGLAPNTIHRFRIKATDFISIFSLERDDYSDIIEERTTLMSPANFASTSSTIYSITLSWSASDDAEGYLISYCKGASCTEFDKSLTITSGATTSTTISGLVPRTAYRFKIKATGEYPIIDSKDSDAIVSKFTNSQLQIPANLAKTQETATSIALSWSSVNNATGYLIQYCGGASCIPNVLSTVSDGATTTKTLTGLVANTVYRVRVNATHTTTALNSDYSEIEEARTALSSPSNFTSTGSTINSITLSWSAVAGSSGYIIDYCDGVSCIEFDESSTVVNSTTTSKTITGLDSDTTYRFKIKATGTLPAIDSGHSAIVSKATSDKLPIPIGLSKTSQTDTSITLGWTAVANATGYTLQYCNGDSCAPVTTATSVTTSTTLTGLVANTVYRVRIKATHTNSALNSDYSAIVEARTALSAPVNFTSTGSTISSVTLSWSAVAGSSGYSIDYCDGVSCVDFANPSTISNSATTSKTIVGLSADTTYRFRIKSTGALPVIDSGYSEIVNKATSDKLPSPVGLSKTSQTDTSITFSWTAVTGATGYTLQHCNGGGCLPRTTTTSTTNSKILTGLTANTVYRVKIKATHTTSSLDSDYSGIIDARTALAPPINLASTASTITSIHLSWDASEGATAYGVDYCDIATDCTDGFVASSTVLSNTTSKKITGLNAKTTYKFRVKATGGAGVIDSAYSNTLNQATSEKLAIPTGLKVTTQTDKSITLSWEEAEESEGYTLQYCNGTSLCIPDTLLSVTGGSTTSTSITGLTSNTIYRVRIQAIHTTDSLKGEYSEIVEARTALSAPVNFRSTGSTINSATLSWGAVVGSGGYIIDYCDGVSCTEFDESSTITNSSTTSKTIVGLSGDTTYRFRIKSKGDGSAIDSGYSAIVDKATSDRLSKPVGLSKTSQTDTSISLSWTAVTGATGYTLQHCSGTTCIPSVFSTVAGNSTTSTSITGLTSNTIYRVRIKATHTTSSLNSNYSGIIDTRTALSAPSSFTSTASTINSVSLSWSAVVGASGYSIDYCDGVSCTDFADDTASTTTSKTIVGLSADTTYRFRIKATGTGPALDSGYSAIVDKATSDRLSKPVGLSKTSETDTSISLSWTAVTGATGYTLQHCSGSATCIPNIFSTVAGNSTTSKTIIGLTANTIYRARIKATHSTSSLNSSYSDIVDTRTALSAPSSFTSIASTINSVSLSWDAVVGATGYTIQYCDGATCTDFADDTTVTTTSKTIVGLSADTTYRFRIKATGTLPVIDSGYSTTVNKVTSDKLPSPSGLSKTFETDTSITLSWTAVVGAAGYTLQHCSGATCAPSTTVVSSNTSQEIQNLTSNTVYRVRIKATHTNSALSSDYSAIVDTRTTLSYPSNFRSTGSTIHSVDLSWDEVAGATGYTIQYCDGVGCTDFANEVDSTIIESITTTSETITGLTADTTYRFRIQSTAVNPAIDSGYSAIVSKVTNSQLPTPVGLSATSQTDTRITLSWTAVPHATGYTLQHCSGATCVPRTTTTSTTTSKILTGLTSNTVYRVKIKATHSTTSLDSDYSEIVDTRTALSAPTNLSSTSATIKSITLSWDEAQGATAYGVDYCDIATDCTDGFVASSSVLSNTTSKKITGLVARTTYKFRVKATGGAGVIDSAYSNTLNQATSEKLAIPTGLKVTSQTDKSITLSWEEAEESEGYTLQYCNGTSLCIPDTLLSVTGGSTTSTSITGLTANTIYRVRIQATHTTDSLKGEYSEIVDTRTALSAPASFTSTASTINSVTLSWSAVAGSGGYIIDYCDGVSCTEFDESSTISNSATTSKTITGLDSDTTYRFKIKATGTLPVIDSGHSAIVSKATTDKLSSPANLRATTQTDTSITLGWAATPEANGYLISYCSGATCTPDETNTEAVSSGTTTSKTLANLTANTAYRVKIKATHTTPALNSDYSGLESVRTALVAPTNFAGADSTILSISLSWDEVAGSTGYKIDYCRGVGCNDFSKSSTVTGGATTSKVIAGLISDNTYRFKIKATGTGSVIDSAYSAAISKATTDKLPTPKNVRASSLSATSIKVDWTAVSNASRYVIQHCEGSLCIPSTLSLTSNGTTTSKTITGLTANTIYKVRVQADHAVPGLESDYSQIVDTRTELAPPANLASTSTTITSVSLSWNAVSGATGYTIQYCDGDSCTDFADDTTSITTTETITGLNANTTYRFRVKATGVAPVLASAYSAALNKATSDKLSSPTGVSASSVSASSIKVDWTAVDNAAGYLIDYCSGTSCIPDATTTVPVSSGTTTSKAVTGLVANTIYRVKIKATHSTPALNSDYSSVVETRTTLATPTNLASTTSTITSVSLSWNAVSGATGYTIQYCDGAGCADFADDTTSTTTTKIITGLTANTTYRFRVKATGVAPVLASGYSAVFNKATSDKLSSPVGLSATLQTDTSITLAWTATSDATGYLIDYCSGTSCIPDATTTVPVSSGTTTSKAVTGLVANTIYRVKIKATHTTPALNSDYSSVVEARTTLPVPTNFASSSSSINSIVLSWDSVIGATGYTIQYCDGGSCTDFAGDTISTNTTHSITNLSPDTTYRFRVMATGAGSVIESPYSVILNKATTDKLPIPNNLRSTSQTATSITVSWEEVADATGYELQYCEGVRCNLGTPVAVVGGSTTSKTISSLNTNKEYSFRIQATHSNSSFNGDNSATIDTRTTIASPSNFISTSSSINSIALSWSEVLGATGYVIEYCDGASCTEFDESSTITSSATTSKIITGLSPNTTYRFRIKTTAILPVIDSGHSNIVAKATSAKLSSPTGLALTSLSSTSIKVDWNEVMNATGYLIQYCDGVSCIPDTPLTVTGGAITTKTLSSLDSGTLYLVRIKATHSSSAFDSDYSGSVSARTLLSIPGNFRSANPTVYSISLFWEEVNGASGYKIDYCEGASCTNFSRSMTITGGATTSEVVSGLDANKVYRFKIKATGTPPVSDSAYSQILNETTSGRLPTPADFKVSKLGANSIKADWTVVTGATGYSIQHCHGEDCTPGTPTTVTGGVVSTKTITGLDANTIYRARIKATHSNSSVNSHYSLITKTRTSLSVPANFASTASSITSITLSWDAVAGSNGYLLQYCDGVLCTEFDESLTITSNATTSKTITGLLVDTTYRFRIKATGTAPALESGYSAILNKDTADKLSTTTNLRVSSQADTSITLSWDETLGAEGYLIQYCNGPRCTPNTPLTITDGETTKKTISSLSVNSAFTAKIKATHSTAGLNGDYSGTINTRTTLSIPDSFRSTSNAATSIVLAWSEVVGANDYLIEYCDGASCNEFDQSVTSTTATKTITGLVATTTYRFRVKARAGGFVVDSGYSVILNKTTSGKLATPGNFRKTQETATSITLSWKSVSDAEGYLIQYCDGATCQPDTLSTVTDGTTTSKTISSLDVNTIYRARIKATHTTSSRNSDYSDLVEARTSISVPDNLRSGATTINAITLLWDEVTLAAGYSIDSCDGTGCTDFSHLSTITGGATTTKTITGLSADTTYRFRIKATGTLPAIDSGYSQILTIATSEKLPIPDNFTVSALNATSIKIDWDKVDNATGYIIKYCDGVRCTLSTTSNVVGGSVITKTLSSLDANTIYRVKIKANHSTSSLDSDYSAIVDTRTFLSVPSNFISTASTVHSVTLSWNEVSDASGYIVDYCDGVGCIDFSDSSTITSRDTTSKTITGLSADTTYRFRIKATGTLPAIDSVYSAIINKVTSDKLSIPSNFSSTSGTDTSITLSWNAVTDSTGYVIKHCGGALCTPTTNVAISSSSTITKKITGLSPFTLHKFQIKATSTISSLDSDYSDILSQSTRLVIPDNFIVASQYESSVGLSWTQTTGATGYVIEYCHTQGCTSGTEVTVDGGATTSKLISALTENTVYRFRIKASHTTDSYNSDYSEFVDTKTTLRVPTEFESTATTSDSITLGWVSKSESSGYVVDYCRGASCTPDETNTEVISSGSTESTIIAGLDFGTTYKFRIKSTGTGTEVDSAYSAVLSTDTSSQLSTPTYFRKTSEDESSISLSWVAPAHATGYVIQYCNGLICTPDTPLTISSGSTTTTKVSSLSANTIYRFKIKATGPSSLADSPYSSSIYTRTTLSMPSNFIKTSFDESSITLGWTGSTGATGYKIKYCDGATCTPDTTETVSGSATTTKKITGLTVNTVYRFKIKTTGSSFTLDSIYSDIIDERTSIAVPNNLATTAQTSQTITLEWDEVSDADGYVIEYCKSTECDDSTVQKDEKTISSGSTTSTTITVLTSNTEYKFKIKSTGTGDKINSIYSDAISQSTLPPNNNEPDDDDDNDDENDRRLPIPDNIRVIKRGATFITVGWDKVNGATGYTVQYCDGTECAPDEVEDAHSAGKREVTITGLTSDTIYRFRVKSTHNQSSRNSEYSAIQDTRTTLNIPENFRHTAKTSSTIALAWDEVSESHGYIIEYCKTKKCRGSNPGTSIKALGGSSTTSVTISGLLSNNLYEFKIKAAGHSPKVNSLYSDDIVVKTSIGSSISSQPTPLSAPTNLAVSSTTNTKIGLSWSTVDNAVGYTIQYCSGDACTPDQEEIVVDGATTSKDITGITPDTLYRFRINAIGIDSYADSPYSEIIENTIPTLPTPTNFIIKSNTETSITLSWDVPPAGSGYTINGYNIRYCSGSSCDISASSSTIIFVSGSDATEKLITGLTKNTLYKLQIKSSSTNISLSSIYTSPIEARTRLSDINDLRIISKTSTTFALSWSEVADADGYKIKYCDGEGCVPDEEIILTSSSTTSKTVTGLTPNTLYKFRIKATHNSETSDSEYSNTVSEKTKLAPPLNFTSTSQTETSIILGWDAVTDASGYVIQHCEGVSCTLDQELTIVGGEIVEKSITGLTLNTLYRFKIKATHADFELISDYSGVFEQKTTIAIPKDLTVTAYGSTSVTLGWSAVTDANIYGIRYCDKGAGCTSYVTDTTSSSSTTSKVITGLSSNTEYKFEIRSEGSGDKVDSPYSSGVSQLTALGIPGNFRSTSKTSRAITLAWDEVSGADGYRILYCDIDEGCTYNTASTVSGGATTTVEIPGFGPETEYKFQIQATGTSPKTTGDYSSAINVSTTSE